MKLHIQGLACTVVSAALLTVSGCGGGGNSTPLADTGNSNSSVVLAAPSDVINGTVAVGAPLDSGTVKVLDARGKLVAGNITIGTDGSYRTPAFKASDFSPPFVIVAEGQVFDAVDTHVALVNAAGVANVTPLSSAMAAGIVGADVLKLSDASVLAGLSSLTTGAVTSGLESVRALVAPMYAAFGGTSSANPLTSTFNDAFDKVLDNLKIDIKPSGVVSILSAESQTGNDETTTTAARPTAISSLSASPLSAPPVGRRTFSVKDAPMLALISKLNNCLSAAPNSNSGRGTPLGGSATACDDLTLDTGDNLANPTETYIHDGKTALQDLAYILAGATGYEQGARVGTPQILRQIDNSTLLVQFPIQGTSASGNQRNTFTSTIKLFSTLNGVTGSEFRLVGNQRLFNVSITASALKVIKTQSSGDPVITFEPSLSIKVGTTSSIVGTTPTPTVGAARICGPGLPGYVSDSDPCGTNGGIWMADAGLPVYNKVPTIVNGVVTGSSGASTYQPGNRCSSGLTYVPFRVRSTTANDNDKANTLFSPSSTETFSTTYASVDGLNCLNNFRLASVNVNGAAVASTSTGQTGAAFLSNYSGTPRNISDLQAGDAYRVYLFGSAASSGISVQRQFTAISTGNNQGYYVVRLASRPLAVPEIISAPFAVFDPALVSSYQSFKTSGPALNGNGQVPVTWTHQPGAVKVNAVNLQYNSGGDQCFTRFSPLAAPLAFPASYVTGCPAYNTAGKWTSSSANITLQGQDRFGSLFITRLQ